MFNFCKLSCEYNFKLEGMARCDKVKKLAAKAGVVFMRGQTNTQLDAVKDGCLYAAANIEGCAAKNAAAAVAVAEETAAAAAAEAAFVAAEETAAAAEEQAAAERPTTAREMSRDEL